jgi:hypothetical protein
MVGPSRTVWKVLRETEGERFVLKNKVRNFLADLPQPQNKFRAHRFICGLRMSFMRSDILSQQRRLQIKKLLS